MKIKERILNSGYYIRHGYSCKVLVLQCYIVSKINLQYTYDVWYTF